MFFLRNNFKRQQLPIHYYRSIIVQQLSIDRNEDTNNTVHRIYQLINVLVQFT